MYPAICDAIHHELEKLDDKYSGGASMTAQDLELVDKMFHALKSYATYDAMKSAEGGRTRRYREYENNDYRRY